MPLSNLTSLMETNCYVDGKKGDFFDLPDKVIDKIFSFLDPEDRMRMRLDKRLNKIEAESKYFIERVELKQSYRNESKCVITKHHEYPFDFIRRIVCNTSIGELQIEFPESIEVARKFYNIIKEFRCIREIWISDSSYTMAGIMTDSFFLDLSNRCESLHLRNVTRNFSHENLHTLYKIIVDDSTCLRYFKFSTLNLKTVKEFLNLLGISYSNGRIMSNRNIQAYKSYRDYLFRQHYVNIVDGCTRILFNHCPTDLDIHTSIEITFHKNQDSLNRFKYNTSLIERKCNGDKGDFFDLLGCPDEIIDKFYSYLDPKERMKMRLNKRLTKIVDESKYYLENVELMQFGGDSGTPYLERKCAAINYIRYPYDVIRRIAHNTSIGWLEIDFPFDDDLGLKFCTIAKEFRCIGEISISFMGGGHPYKILTDSFFLDLSRKCESLNIHHTFIIDILPKILHDMYKSMHDGSASIRCIHISEITRDTRNSFLKLLGITYNNGRVISNKNIEAYKDTDDYLVSKFDIHIFDGFSHISFEVGRGEEEYDGDDDVAEDGAYIEVKWHTNQKSFNRAKNIPRDSGWKRIKMDVIPE